MKTTSYLIMALLAAFSALLSAYVAASYGTWTMVLVFAALSALNLGIAAQSLVNALTSRRFN